MLHSGVAYGHDKSICLVQCLGQRLWPAQFTACLMVIQQAAAPEAIKAAAGFVSAHVMATASIGADHPRAQSLTLKAVSEWYGQSSRP